MHGQIAALSLKWLGRRQINAGATLDLCNATKQ